MNNSDSTYTTTSIGYKHGNKVVIEKAEQFFLVDEACVIVDIRQRETSPVKVRSNITQEATTRVYLWVRPKNKDFQHLGIMLIAWLCY